MSTGQLLMAFAVGTAALALWSYVRWPGAAPDTMTGAVLRVLLAFGLLQVGLAGLKLGIETVPGLGVIIFVGAVVPVLTYTFLAALWFMKVCADQMRGAF